MKKISYIFIIILLGIIVGALFWTNDEGETDPMQDDHSAATSTEAVTFSGEITELDYSEIAVDGPYRIMLETSAGESRTVLVPSMGINLCAAQENIVNLDSLLVGDVIEVRGSAGSEPDSITVCESTDHYLELDDSSDWQTYESEAYEFTLSYPSGWDVATDTTPTSEPLISFYRPNKISTEAPFTHHSSETHVSMYPQGIPTEGVSGERKTSSVGFVAPINRADDYLLSDGTVFATYANVETLVDAWNESGFLFAHTAIDSLETECRRDGEEISMEQCDVLMGDTLIRSGEIDESVRAQQVQMLESFRIGQ